MTVTDLTHTTRTPARGSRWRRTASRAWRGVVAGLATAVVLGLTARLLMRLATLAVGGEPGFSWGGTLGICLGWAVFTLPGALVAALYLGRGRSLVLVGGGVWLAFFATQVARSDLDGFDLLSRAEQVGAVSAAAGITLAALAVPWAALRFLRALGL